MDDFSLYECGAFLSDHRLVQAYMQAASTGALAEDIIRELYEIPSKGAPMHNLVGPDISPHSDAVLHPGKRNGPNALGPRKKAKQTGWKG